MARWTHSVVARVALAAALSVVPCLLWAVSPGSQATANVTGYYVCTLDVNVNGAPSVYMSDVIPNTGFRPGVISTPFRQFVADTYKVNGQPLCVERSTEAQARDYMQTSSPGQKKVMTGWKPSGSAAPAPARQAAPSAPAATASQTSGSAINGFCYFNFPGSPDYASGQPTYFTPIFTFSIESPASLFVQYVTKKYAIQHGSAPSCTRGALTVSQLTPQRDRVLARVKELGGTVVETEWTDSTHQALMAALPQNPPAAPTTATRPVPNTPPPTVTPPPTPVTTPRPAVTTPRPTATPPPSTPAPSGPAMYSYCTAYGTPAGASGNVKQHFYISQPFQISASERASLNQDFEKFLRGAHAGETISASCLAPGPVETAQKNRQTTIDVKRKQTAQFEIVEVEWKR